MRRATYFAITILCWQMTGLGFSALTFCLAPSRQKLKREMERKSIEKVQQMIGKTVELCGEAGDAKAGALIVTKEGHVIYLMNMARWPDVIIGKEICVKGKLRRMKYIPDPQRDVDGAISQGADGEQYVIEKGKWRRVEGVHPQIGRPAVRSKLR